MTHFERNQVYGRCIVCCDWVEVDGVQSACSECWRSKRSFTTDGRRVVVCEPIPFREWSTD